MRPKAYPLLTLVIFTVYVIGKDVRKLCTSSLGNKSCGQCIKQHPECAWCHDPHMAASSRCDLKSEFLGKCNPTLIYSPSTEIRITPQNNLPLGSKHADGATIVQLEPQQVLLRMKPGDIVEVPFKYLHRPHQSNQKDFLIQTSEFRSLGVGIEFFILCDGKRVQGRQCQNIQLGEQIEFFAKVSLNECKSGGDVAVSIGAYGYQTVSALYITPLCGCDCEKVQNQERRSPLCYGAGDLICGLCECEVGKGGSHCECDLHQYGVSTAQELENKCRKTPKDLICSGNGQCKCGRCLCNVEHVHGDYCECENMSCPKVDDRLCAGQGECSCGKCRCEEGFTGEDCSCILDTTPCLDGNGLCNNRGTCECGKCICQRGYSGLTCGIAVQNEEVMDEEMTKSDESTHHEKEQKEMEDDDQMKYEGKEEIREDGDGDDLSEELKKDKESSTMESSHEETGENDKENIGQEEESDGIQDDEHNDEGVMDEERQREDSEVGRDDGNDDGGDSAMGNEEDAGEVLPPGEDDVDKAAGSDHVGMEDGEAARGEAGGEEVTLEPVREGQTAGGLRIDGNFLSILIILILFWC